MGFFSLKIMDELFKKLELKIVALQKRCFELEDMNLHLKQSKSILMREKEALLAKNKIAITQIENMVNRLKSIEGTT